MKKELTASSEDLKKKFYNLKTLDDLADLLEVSKSKLYYYAYKAKLDNHYKKIILPKKSGGKRRIYAPSSPLKLIQKKLSRVFQEVYFVKASVHGFVQGKSVLTNAKRHLEKGRKKFVLNADLDNFFPTITMMRVENLLKAKPYNLPPLIAHTIASLTCYMSILPQGAPSSPIISNMICAKMDTRLRRLAQSNKCTYTRYADDITISTTLLTFPGNIATYNNDTKLTVAGLEFQTAIEENGFKLNEKKMRLQNKYKRQEVTGLVVNSFPNVSRKFVRQIRAMLFAWEKFGYDNAQKEYLDKYTKHPSTKKVSFKKVIKGKLEYLKMIKGESDSVYLGLQNKLLQLDPEFSIKIPKTKNDMQFDIKVLTEGQSDWKHLKSALEKFQRSGEYLDLSIEFEEKEISIGDSELLNHCKYNSPPFKTEICIFDRDKEAIIKQVTVDETYKKWKDKLFSFALPIPSHRKDTPEVCIELYYQDTDIKRKDKNNRRLFLSNEFHEKSGRHKTEDLIYSDIKKGKGKLTVIEDLVFNSENANIALPKNDFSKYIFERTGDFSEVDISEFRLIFNMIRKIVIENK